VTFYTIIMWWAFIIHDFLAIFFPQPPGWN